MGCVTSWNCGNTADFDHTFSIQEMTINGDTIQLPNPYSEEMLAISGGTSNINWISANNDVVSGATTGLTYTNFVDFLNNAFDELGVYPRYRAQISTEKTVNGYSGFYIIKPETDTFSFLIVQTGSQSIDKFYTDQGAGVLQGVNAVDIDLINGQFVKSYYDQTPVDIFEVVENIDYSVLGGTYETSSCEGNEVVKGNVVE